MDYVEESSVLGKLYNGAINGHFDCYKHPWLYQSDICPPFKVSEKEAHQCWLYELIIWVGGEGVQVLEQRERERKIERMNQVGLPFLFGSSMNCHPS